MGRLKGSKNKPKLDGAFTETFHMPEISSEKAGVVVQDPLDKKLDYFQYATDDRSADIWEHGEDINPLSVPKDIRKKYPNLRFHWCANRKWDKRGANYDGWQVFKDAQLCPDGLKRANDLFLAAMPEERARKRDRFVQQRSTDVIRGVQERNLESLDRIQHSEDSGISPLDTEVRGVEIGKRAETHINFGGKPRKGGGYHRGYSPEEIQELVAKNREKLARGRKYFT